MSYGAPNLPADKHFFFDRHGGVSAGKYASLNGSIKSDDDRENVLKNFALAAAHYHLPFERLAIVRQGTTNHAVFISQPERWQQFADGMVTDIPGIILTLRTAGWRGALYGIIENTLQLMLEHGAEKANIAAALGPCLQQQSFECRSDMRNEFLRQDTSFEQFFIPASNHGCFRFDLEAFVIRRLQNFGLTDISASSIDTYRSEDYFSYRRNTHRGLLNSRYDYPTHLSTITL